MLCSKVLLLCWLILGTHQNIAVNPTQQTPNSFICRQVLVAVVSSGALPCRLYVRTYLRIGALQLVQE